MKCPIFYLGFLVQGGLPDGNEDDCLKEECAWWLETQGECAIKQLSLSLGFISLDTTQLLEKKLQEKKI